MKKSFVVIILLAYFIIFGRIIPQELAVIPLWSTDLDSAAVGESPSGESPFPFKSGSRFGYMYSNGNISYVDTILYGTAIDDAGFINYSRQNDLLVVRNSEGVFQNTVSIPGYPYFSGTRRFIVFYDNSRLSEIDETGTIIWQKSFSAMITSIYASPEYLFVGTVDGKLWLLDKEGGTLFTYVDKKSRINVIYGGTISDSGEIMITLSGIDPQVVSLWVKDDDSYTIDSQWIIDKALRREAVLGFSEDGLYGYVEEDGGILIVDLKKKKIESVKLEGRIHAVSFPGKDELICILSRDREGFFFSSIEADGNKLFLQRLNGSDVMFQKESSVLVLGFDNTIYGFSMESM